MLSLHALASAPLASGPLDVLSTPPVGDTAIPVMVGAITITAITSSGAHAAWPQATDDVAVAGYEVSVDTGVPVWVDVGNVTSCDISGKASGTTFTFRSRAYDGVGKRAAPITKDFTTAAEAPQSTSVTVPTARTAKFTGRSRVAVFSGTAPVVMLKGALDELYIIGDFSKDYLEAGTTAESVTGISEGVTVLEAADLQKGFGVVKLGVLDLNAARCFFTFRVKLANGEQVDRTVELKALDDAPKVFGKDPDDKRFYSIDFGSDATLGGTSLAAVSASPPVGVSVLSQPTKLGNIVTFMIGGLDTAVGAVNSYTLSAVFANTEKVVRTIYFKHEDH